MHNQAFDDAVNMTLKANAVAALMQTNNPKSDVNKYVPNVCIAMSCKWPELP